MANGGWGATRFVSVKRGSKDGTENRPSGELPKPTFGWNPIVGEEIAKTRGMETGPLGKRPQTRDGSTSKLPIGGNHTYPKNRVRESPRAFAV